MQESGSSMASIVEQLRYDNERLKHALAQR